MDFVGKRRWFFILSAIIILPGIFSLIIPPSLNLGIDFTGGATLTVKFAEPVDVEVVRAALTDLGHPGASVQGSRGIDYFIRTTELETRGTDERQALLDALGGLAEIERHEFASVSGVIAGDTVRNSFLIVFISAIAILLFVTYAFRTIPSPFRYGVAAIVALVHDLLIVLGIFSILGKLFDVEVNLMFITGLLFVIGYSVNDTIVVFDRIRENVSRVPGQALETSVNISILETLGRSMNTSLTILFAILALLLLGGESIQNFLLVLLIGVVSGTYSSICIASQVLVVWETGEGGRFFRKLPFFPTRSEA